MIARPPASQPASKPPPHPERAAPRPTQLRVQAMMSTSNCAPPPSLSLLSAIAYSLRAERAICVPPHLSHRFYRIIAANAL